MTVLLSLSFIPAQLQAGTEAVPASVHEIKAVDAAKAQTLIARLNEINAMDKSTLNKSEKKQLRIEVRHIRSQLKELNSGIYLSVGAVIIILLLLILLF